VNLTPESVKLFTNSHAMPSEDNHKRMTDLKVKDNQVIVVVQKLFTHLRVPLIADGMLIPRFQQALDELFARFASQTFQPAPDQPEIKGMTRRDMVGHQKTHPPMPSFLS
jgi:hypothetical protein